MNAKIRKIIIALAVAFFAPLGGLRADTSYLLIQGPFGSDDAEETFQWQVNYPAGYLLTGQDLLNTVFGSPSLNGTYTDAFGETYNYYTAGNSTQGAGYIDFGTDPSKLTAPFLASVTLDAATVEQDTGYINGWNYYVAGGGSNFGNGYPNDGVWTFSEDGSLARTLVNGSFDAWVFGANDAWGDPVTFVDGDNNTPTEANFAGATVINIVPEPGSVALLLSGAGGMLALYKRRRAWPCT